MLGVNDTFLPQLFFRGFTITGRTPFTNNMLTKDNQTFVGYDFIINYENI